MRVGATAVVAQVRPLTAVAAVSACGPVCRGSRRLLGRLYWRALGVMSAGGHSLVVGSLALSPPVGVMWATRRIDWYPPGPAPG